MEAPRSMNIMRAVKMICLLGVTMGLVTRSAWGFEKGLLDSFSQKVSAMVCSDEGKWLSCYQMEPSECSNVADSFVQPCTQEILGSVSSMLSYQEGRNTAKRLLECFNERFEESYAAQRLSTEECKQPPAHLLPSTTGSL